MRLSQVMAGTGVTGAEGVEVEVRDVAYDSRRAGPGSLFFALSGTRADGAAFARLAVENGAAAVVSERPLDLPAGTVQLQAGNPRRAMAIAADNIHGRPSRRMTLLGISGTNGKTTTSWLVDAMLRAAGVRTGLVGTVAWRIGEETEAATHTTPESVELHGLFARMRDAKVQAVAMEVSSHALAQERVAGLSYSAAAFTNLTRDHLDYHGTMEAYFEAKARLFKELLAGPAVINADDPWGIRLMNELTKLGRTVWGFSAQGASELYVADVEADITGCRGTMITPRGTFPFASPLVGRHNLENLLAAAGVVLAAGYDVEAVQRGIASFGNVPGRLERISAAGVHVFVDYAHTDDALARVLAALRPVTSGRLISVFGCGGDRDRGKRPLMGEAAAKGSDLVVVTSDNPRTEAPEAIIEEILPGLRKGGVEPRSAEALRDSRSGFAVEPDRRAAIALALSAAREGDVVLIAGKGHEDYQIVGTEKRHFDDREEARRAMGIG